MSETQPGFHINLHAGVTEAAPTEADSTKSESTAACIPPERLATPFPASFEELAARLAGHPRLYFEPDGSFVWTGELPDGRRWQLDGVVYDRNGHVLYIELKGNAPSDVLAGIVQACGLDTSAVLVQRVRDAGVVPLPDFLRDCCL